MSKCPCCVSIRIYMLFILCYCFDIIPYYQCLISSNKDIVSPLDCPCIVVFAGDDIKPLSITQVCWLFYHERTKGHWNRKKNVETTRGWRRSRRRPPRPQSPFSSCRLSRTRSSSRAWRVGGMEILGLGDDTAITPSVVPVPPHLAATHQQVPSSRSRLATHLTAALASPLSPWAWRPPYTWTWSWTRTGLDQPRCLAQK